MGVIQNSKYNIYLNIQSIIKQMKGYDPINFTRQKWYDPKKVKNRSHTCDKSHSFCNFEYEWGNEVNKLDPINRPINPAYTNSNLPMPAQKVIRVNYDSITQQNLDDWVAQSINRNLGSMLNPQKKFFLPPGYDEELRARYKKNKEIKRTQNETYFKDNQKIKKTAGYLSNDRRKQISVHSLYFDYNKLQPHQDMSGTPIKLREIKKTQKKDIRRRNAVILNNDIHYARFMKEFNKQKNVEVQKVVKEPEIVPQKQMIYSFNIESMSRKSCFDDVPNSLIERQYERIKQPQNDLLTSHRALMSKQQEFHEKYRLQMNEKTTSAINQIKEMANMSKQQKKETITSQTKKQTTTIKQKGNSNPIHIEQKQQTKDKKYLQTKVIKLLNDMQVQSESIDENMAKLNIHVQQIFLQHPDSRPQTKWILKAQQKINDKKNLLAIDCYKQAIILQPQLFIPVFNIAALLEKQNMLSSALSWFKLASEFQTDSENVIFGMSLVALKQLKFSQALSGINELISKLEEAGKKIQSVYYYVRALCNKELGFFKQAKQDYNTISKSIKPTNFNVLPQFIFSVVFAQHRRIPLQFNCLSYMLFKETMFLILYQEQKKVKQNDQNLIDIATKLVTNSFFCRFSLNLVKKLLTISKYQEKEKGEIIFSSPNHTSIIINGIVSLKSHQSQFNRPNMVDILMKGDIIGAGDLQNNISSKPNNWFMAQSKVQLLIVPKLQFMQFWKGQITFQMDIKYNFLKNIQLFKGLPECTLFKLCQLFEKKTYEKGTILFNDCSYRIQMLSKPGKGYGLAKNTHKADGRMVYSGPISKQKQTKGKRRGKSKLFQILRKHIFKFNEMKFNRTKYPGLFVVTKGIVELEDDRGFRCNGMIGQREFFGQTLLVQSDGYHNYGRMVAQSQNVEVLLLDIEKLTWLFNQQDKNIMKENCKNRQCIETVRLLRNRFLECQNTKMKYKFNS